MYIDRIFHGNCIDGMDIIPDNSVDLVITDPPFAIDYKAKRTNYNRTGSRVPARIRGGACGRIL